MLANQMQNSDPNLSEKGLFSRDAGVRVAGCPGPMGALECLVHG